MAVLRWLPSALLLLPWLLGPLAPSSAVRIRDVAGASSFRLLDWETVQLGTHAGRLWAGLFGDAQVRVSDDDVVRAYFEAPAGPAREAMRVPTEAALERLVARAYIDGGLSRSQPLPLDRLFPPVLVTLTAPPNVLVIAPRTELRVIDSSVMQALDVPQQESIEASADSTGVSSLIAPIGGLATYPSMVLEEDAPDRVLSSVAHEWVHQYLVFYPLGAGYWKSQETREINETTADMIGQEVGRGLASSLGLLAPPAASGAPPPAATRGAPAFDFRAFMRDTRQTTEQLLAVGDVASAEALMNDRAAQLRQRGYQIRKLNQAYFALYGSYGDGFAASPTNPIPDSLRTLRARSASLGDFVVQVRSITTVAQLRAAVSG